MAQSFGWGILAGSSLVLGGLLVMSVRISSRTLGLVMAFGSGVLISAVSFELVQEAFDIVSGLAALAGYALLDTASPTTIAIVLSFAGGAILTMLADTMMPEAFAYEGKLVGLVTTLGFALAFGISALE